MNLFNVLLANWFSRVSALKIFFFFLLFGIGLYSNVISYPFIHDDQFFIVNNSHLSRWDDLPDIFFHPHTFSVDTQAIVNSYYRPVLEIVNKILFLFFGQAAAGYHFFNIFLHAINSFLVYILILGFSRRKALAFAVGILFLVHPVQSEAVCAIAGISNLLSSLFCFGSFYFYVRHQEEGGQRRSGYLFIALVLFLLALLTKESVVIFPFLLVVYEFLRKDSAGEQKSLRKILLVLVPFFCLLAGYFLLRKGVLSNALPSLGASSHELWLRILSIPETILMYLQIFIVPYGLHYYRSVDILHGSIYPSIILFFLFLFGAKMLQKISKDEQRLAFFGLAWFFIALFPMINIIPIINEYSIILTAEHFLYFPFLGFILFSLVILNRALVKISGNKGTQIVVFIFIVEALILSVLTRVQSHYWRGDVPLFQRTLCFYPNFGRVRLFLAKAYYQRGDYLRAIDEYKKGLSIMEEYLSKTKGAQTEEVYRLFIKEIYFDLAQCYDRLGRFQEAIYTYWQAQEFDPKDARIYNSLGIDYLQIKEPDEAAICFKKALEFKPEDIALLNNLAFCYLQKSNFEEAEKTLQKALFIDPASELTKRNLEAILRAKNSAAPSKP